MAYHSFYRGMSIWEPQTNLKKWPGGGHPRYKNKWTAWLPGQPRPTLKANSRKGLRRKIKRWRLKQKSEV